MTTEEAIKQLDYLEDWFSDMVGHTDLDTLRCEALRMAINALRKQKENDEENK